MGRRDTTLRPFRPKCVRVRKRLHRVVSDRPQSARDIHRTVRFHLRRVAPLPASEVVISETLANAGYTTMLIADTPHILQRGFHFDRGFTAWDWIRGQENDRLRTDPQRVELPSAPHKLREPEMTMGQYLRNIADWQEESDRFCPTTFTRACQWLEQNAKSKPFFLHVDTFDPHEPWDPPQSDADRYDPGYEGERVTYPVYGYWEDFLSPAELRHSHALYCGEVSMVDRWFGRILETMDRLDLWTTRR